MYSQYAIYMMISKPIQLNSVFSALCGTIAGQRIYSLKQSIIVHFSPLYPFSRFSIKHSVLLFSSGLSSSLVQHFKQKLYWLHFDVNSSELVGKGIPRTCWICSISLMCFLLHACLNTLCCIFFIRKKMENGAGPVCGTFMQILLWTAGMIMLFNLLETQFSIITRYAPYIPPMQCLC